MKNIKTIYLLIILSFLISLGCQETAFLNTRPDQSLRVPSKLSDYQALLDNDPIMNLEIIPDLGEIGTDNYYLQEKYYSVYLRQVDQNEYVWASDPYPGMTVTDWNIGYRSILYCNIVLEGLADIQADKNQKAAYDNIVGSALFYRAHAFYQLAQVFGQPYDSITADRDLGIPLRLSSDIIQNAKRASVEQTYNRIITDLRRSCGLLPATPLYKTRPSKTAAYALLARTYQTMQRYHNAFLYADSALMNNSALIDFNDLDSNLDNSIPRFNNEVIYYATINNHITNSIGTIDSGLYRSYDTNDLRRVILYRLSRGLPRIKGNYNNGSGYSGYYGGIATDEIYLIRAECYARMGDITDAMNDLNTLLKTRWRKDNFVPYAAVDAEDALKQVLEERRKELVYRGLRWTDLRRLNKDSRFKKTLVRNMLGHAYTLPPGDSRYTWPIPDDVLGFNPDMKQNTR